MFCVPYIMIIISDPNIAWQSNSKSIKSVGKFMHTVSSYYSKYNALWDDSETWLVCVTLWLTSLLNAPSLPHLFTTCS